jgi:hypothetical protein
MPPKKLSMLVKLSVPAKLITPASHGALVKPVTNYPSLSAPAPALATPGPGSRRRAPSPVQPFSLEDDATVSGRTPAWGDQNTLISKAPAPRHRRAAPQAPSLARPTPPRPLFRPPRLLRSCCLRCSKHYGSRPHLYCRRPRPFLKCSYCTVRKRPCLPVSISFSPFCIFLSGRHC